MNLIKNMVLENIHGLMADNMRVIGPMGSKISVNFKFFVFLDRMDMGNIRLVAELKKKAFGKMGKGLSGLRMKMTQNRKIDSGDVFFIYLC